MQLARWGGLSGQPVIDPGGIDGYIQAIRGGGIQVLRMVHLINL